MLKPEGVRSTLLSWNYKQLDVRWNSDAKIKFYIFIDICRILQISPNLSVYIEFEYENKSPRAVFYAISDSGSYSGGRLMLFENFQKNEFLGHVTGKDRAGSPGPGNGQA